MVFRNIYFLAPWERGQVDAPILQNDPDFVPRNPVENEANKALT